MSRGFSVSWWRHALGRPHAWALLGGFAIVTINLVSISAAGPWDPWETHYGEVARQMVLRHDPLDLWWQPGNGGPDGRSETYFASKPALPFWLMALSMKVLGVGTGGDPAEMVRPFWPELSIRLPSMLAGMATAVFLGAVVWRLVSPRGGVLAGVIVSTMPQWAMVTRQALTDMFFVGPVCVAVGAWALAWLRPDRPLDLRPTFVLPLRGERLVVPWDRAHAAFFVVFVVAAVVPLAMLHYHAFDPFTWTHLVDSSRKAQGLRSIQVHMFAYWALALVVLVRSLYWRRRSQALMGILYLAAGLSLLGKGLIGPGLVGAVVLAYLFVSGRWGLLRTSGLLTGLVLFALVAFPWHHAMVLYRGEPWIQELIIENNLRRFASGEQPQAVGGFIYYVETLGLAALPWSALAPVAIWAGFAAFGRKVGRDHEIEDGGTRLYQLATLWLAVSLFVIALSTTKYYHYLAACLPPLAIMIAVWLDRAVDRRHFSRAAFAGVLVGLGILVAVVRDAAASPAWIAHLTTYAYTGHWARGAPDVTRLAYTVAPFGLGLGLYAVGRRRFAALLYALSGLLTSAYVIDDYLPAVSENWSQRSALRIYFDERGPKDRLVSWAFYYRGETFFTKRDVWVAKSPDRRALADYIAQREGKGGALWFITLESQAGRLPSQLPPAYRDDLEEVYGNFHHVLMRLRTP